MPTLDENELRHYGAILHKIKDASFFPLINDRNSHDKNQDHHLLMITGQIPRETSFEKGLPPQYKEEDNDNEKCLVPDPLVNDDQALIAKILDTKELILCLLSYLTHFLFLCLLVSFEASL